MFYRVRNVFRLFCFSASRFWEQSRGYRQLSYFGEQGVARRGSSVEGSVRGVGQGVEIQIQQSGLGRGQLGGISGFGWRVGRFWDIVLFLIDVGRKIVSQGMFGFVLGWIGRWQFGCAASVCSGYRSCVQKWKVKLFASVRCGSGWLSVLYIRVIRFFDFGVVFGA